MGQKASPVSMRLGINRDWSSRWFGGAKYPQFLKDDLAIREFLLKRLKNMGVDSILIERGNNAIRVTIHSARPGLIIGRGGTGIQELNQKLGKLLKFKTPLQLEVQEVKNPDGSAAVIAEHIVDQIERRTPYRRIMKMTIQKVMASRAVKGVKLQLSGRLDGAEIARVEHMEEGSLPLQTLRADVDFVRATAHTTYGTVGVKVWVYKGEVFENEKNA
ncbi:MAG: 30S ribosomal protein S3 [Candidatus Yanofskybacteria bacterium]|nr:30S ribosomal protein S3 [Candidatus Yanofskybacteria bacterium]